MLDNLTDLDFLVYRFLDLVILISDFYLQLGIFILQCPEWVCFWKEVSVLVCAFTVHFVVLLVLFEVSDLGEKMVSGSRRYEEKTALLPWRLYPGKGKSAFRISGQDHRYGVSCGHILS